MNPAILDYMRNSQQQQSNQQPMQQPQQMQQPQAPQQVPYNPFSSGIANAIESARASMSMSREQGHNALRKGILATANQLGQQPRERGFTNNLGSIMRAVGPGVEAYGNAENQSMQDNQVMADKLLAYQAQEQERQAREQMRRSQEDDRAWSRDFHERQFGEQQKQHNLMNHFRELQFQQQNGEPVNNVPEGLIPIADKKERNAYLKDRKALGSTLHEVQELENAYKEIRQSTANNTFDPMLPVGRMVAKAEGLFGGAFNSKDLLKEKAARDTFNSRINKFVATSERALKGGGILGPQIIKMFKEQGIYPSYEDSPESFESKLKVIKDEIEKSYKSADASLQYGAHITPLDLERLEQPASPSIENMEESMDGAPQRILMRDPDSGEEDYVPADRAQEALADGLIPVR